MRTFCQEILTLKPHFEDVRERFEDSPKTPEIQDMGSYRDSEKA